MITTPIQKRFADIDMLGHVNNVNVQHYFDLGKSEFFRHVLDLHSHLKGTGLITAATSTSYIKQTRLDDTNHVETATKKIGNKSITLTQRLVDTTSGEVNVESISVMVAFDFSGQESVELPEQWRDALSEHLEI